MGSIAVTNFRAAIRVVDVKRYEAPFWKAELSVGRENIALDVRKVKNDGHGKPLNADDARRLRRVVKIAGFVVGDELREIVV